MILLAGRHPLREPLEAELAGRAAAYQTADSLAEIPFTLSMDDAGSARVVLLRDTGALELGPGDAIANFLAFPGLATDDFPDMERWAAWWALLGTARCRTWNGPSPEGFPAPAEELVFAAVLRDACFTIPVCEATGSALGPVPSRRQPVVRDVVTGEAASTPDTGLGVVRRTLVDPRSTRYLLWVAGQMTDLGSDQDDLGDAALVEAMAPVSRVLSSHRLGAAIVVVQQDARGTAELLAVRPALEGASFWPKQHFAARAIAAFLTA
jgi:hypothetical protein